MHVVNENENRNENTCKNEEKTLTKILKTKTKTIIESKTKLLVKTKIVQLTENSHSVFSVQQVDSVQPSSSNRAKPALPEAKFTLLPDFKLCCTLTSLARQCDLNVLTILRMTSACTLFVVMLVLGLPLQNLYRFAVCVL